MTGIASTFFDNEILNSPFRTMLHHENGRIFVKANLHQTRSSTHKSMLHFATVGSYLIGIPIKNDHTNLQIEEVINEELGVIQEFDSSENVAFMRQKIEQNSKGELHNLISFSLIKDFILRNYWNSEICVLRYGQKTPLDTQLKLSIQEIYLLGNIIVDVGVALMYNSKGSYVAANLEYFSGSRKFSVFQSEIAGNVMLKNPSKYISNAYKQTIYNNLHHIKEECEGIIKTSKSNHSMEESIKCKRFLIFSKR